MKIFSRVSLSRSIFSVLLCGIVGCDSNPSSPGVKNIFTDDGTVTAGTVVTLYVEFFIDAQDTGAKDRTSNPFSLFITLPPGATYVSGTSALAFQPVREPDSVGNCANGGTFLNYNFAAGEVNNQYDFKTIADDLGVNVILGLAANDGVAATAASSIPFANPCLALEQAEMTFSVNSN